jgi:hypothetical protein
MAKATELFHKIKDFSVLPKDIREYISTDKHGSSQSVGRKNNPCKNLNECEKLHVENIRSGVNIL